MPVVAQETQRREIYDDAIDFFSEVLVSYSDWGVRGKIFVVAIDNGEERSSVWSMLITDEYV